MTMNLKEQLAALQKAMAAIVAGAKSAGRDLTASEISDLEAKADQALDLKAKIDHAAKSDELIARLGAMPGDGAESAPGKSANWGEIAAEAMQKRAGEYGIKALIGTTVDTPAVITNPVLLPEVPTSVLDLIPTSPFQQNGTDTTNTFTYARQTTRTNNAAAVADGGQKPTSIYTFTEIEDRLRVYAHVSEALPERFLADYATLVSILSNELGNGIRYALEADIVSGSGTGEVFKGILNTSGIQTQAAVGTDVLATLSAAYMDLVANGDTPNAWLINPTDYAALSLMRESGTSGALMFGSGRSTLQNIIGSAPIIPTARVSAGTVLVGDFSQTKLLVRQNTELKPYQDATMIEHNQVKFRAEGRFGFQVLRPASFVKVTLPSAG
jgi:HK97 family phage major capsid protein